MNDFQKDFHKINMFIHYKSLLYVFSFQLKLFRWLMYFPDWVEKIFSKPETFNISCCFAKCKQAHQAKDSSSSYFIFYDLFKFLLHFERCIFKHYGRVNLLQLSPLLLDDSRTAMSRPVSCLRSASVVNFSW